MLNELSLRQLKYISDNLDSCSKLIKSAVSTRTDYELMSGNTVEFAKKVTQKENPSDFYKFRLFTTEITLFFEKQYYICFTGITLQELNEFFQYLKKFHFLESFRYNDIIFDDFAVYKCALPGSDFNVCVNYFMLFVKYFINFKSINYENLF